MPKIQQKRCDWGIVLDLPGYDIRHAIQTSDPQAVMESFKVHMILFFFSLVCDFVAHPPDHSPSPHLEGDGEGTPIQRGRHQGLGKQN